jgi:hypothetical protein
MSHVLPPPPHRRMHRFLCYLEATDRCCEGRRNRCPRTQFGLPQLPLFASHSPTYQDALAHAEAIRPILTREHTLALHSRETGLNY